MWIKLNLRVLCCNSFECFMRFFFPVCVIIEFSGQKKKSKNLFDYCAKEKIVFWKHEIDNQALNMM
jgi:hypothetical protein